MSNRVVHSIARMLLSAALLTVAFLNSPAQAATPPSATPPSVAGDGAAKGTKGTKSTTERLDPPPGSEAYERVHEPKERSEQREVAREGRNAGQE